MPRLFTLALVQGTFAAASTVQPYLKNVGIIVQYAAHLLTWSSNSLITENIMETVPLSLPVYNDVIVGRWTVGKQGMKVCPTVPGEQYARFNSLVNNVADPTIFVVQHFSQAYLTHLITYH